MDGKVEEQGKLKNKMGRPVGRKNRPKEAIEWERAAAAERKKEKELKQKKKEEEKRRKE